MEELYAELLLCYGGLCSWDRYRNLLDEKFINEPGNDLYLDLEDCASSLLNSMGRFNRYWNYESSKFDCNVFGKRLFESLKCAYDMNQFEIIDFGKRCYKLWYMLPDSIKSMEPFHILSYADDPLSWGDEKQSRKLYENAFSYYVKCP